MKNSACLAAAATLLSLSATVFAADASANGAEDRSAGQNNESAAQAPAPIRESSKPVAVRHDEQRVEADDANLRAEIHDGQPGFKGRVDQGWNIAKGSAIDVKDRSVNAWDNGGWDAYLPFYSYHPAWVYSAETRHNFHDDAWGAGVGKHWEDKNGNEDLVYAMVFTESHGHAEPIVGYARQWYTDPIVGDFKVGGGYTVGITSRPDIWSGVPFPLALPVISAKAGRFSLMSAIVPDTKGLRAMLFWARVELGPQKPQ